MADDPRAERAAAHATDDQPAVRLLMLGAPGAGKGTQGVRLAERHGARHVSTGDLLRRQVADGTPLGQEAQPYMERGDLVPDRLVMAMVLEDVLGPSSPPSYVLDGFPRTLPQAEAAYEQAVASDRVLDAVVCLDIDDEELVDRLARRGREQGRADDDVETVRHRIAEYREKTLPLLDYYEGRDILVRVDGTGEVDEVTERVEAALLAALQRRARAPRA
jgi:adenylate kinase